jgi:DNA-binding Lrp family transcriptional regulator
MFDLAHVLFQSRTRVALLQLLLADGVSDSMSGLARRAKISQHAVAVEVKNLAKAGLLKIESVGAADLVAWNAAHPAAKPLLELLRLSRSTRTAAPEDSAVQESLVAYGAPLLAFKGRKHMPLELALVRALRLARHDASLLKILPVVVARNVQALNWEMLKETARREKLKAELGMLVEMTADAARMPELKAKVSDLRDRRRTLDRFFIEPSSKYERELAKKGTPPAARRWHFLMNLGADTFRATMVKHLA